MKKLIGSLLIACLLLLAPAAASAQCPMCKAAVTTGSNYGAKESKLVAGLNSGILYLFLLPYGSLMLVGVVIVYNYRKNRMRGGQVLSETTVEDVIGDHRPSDA